MTSLRIHYIEHVPYENPGYILTWAQENNHILSSTRLYENEDFPDLQKFDWLVIMGGPMSVHDEYQYPWLKKEKLFIQSAIKANKTVIGICLGAQLLALVLGARVYPNPKKEIGWFPVMFTDSGKAHPAFMDFPDSLMVFHWHGETFDLPQNALHLFKTDICENQAFLYHEKVLGLQFHPEATPDTIKEMIANCGNELIEGDFIQNAGEITSQINHQISNKYLTLILNYLS